MRDQGLLPPTVQPRRLEEASRALTTYDIRWGCDVLRHVYDSTDGVDLRITEFDGQNWEANASDLAHLSKEPA